MEPEDSLPCPQEPATDPYPESDASEQNLVLECTPRIFGLQESSFCFQ